MKKFVVMMIFAFVAAFSVSICSAYVYDSDPDYVYLGTYGSGGYSTYFYVPSVNVQEYNPPHYQIAGDFVTIGGKKIISESWQNAAIRFNWYTKETYHINGYGNWEKEDINMMVDGKFFRKRADALFRAAYNMDFYGY